MKRTFLFLCLAACGGTDVVVIPTQMAQGVVDVTKLQSFELWVLDQLGRDNNPISCEALLSRQLSPLSANVVPLQREPVSGVFSDGSIVAVKGLRKGDRNTIFYVDVYDQPDGLGSRIAAGCVPAQTIKGGQTLRFALEIDAAPLAQ